MLVKRDQVAHDPVVEPERTLILRENGRLGLESRDGIVAVLALADGIRELSPAPMINGDVALRREKAVKA